MKLDELNTKELEIITEYRNRKSADFRSVEENLDGHFKIYAFFLPRESYGSEPYIVTRDEYTVVRCTETLAILQDACGQIRKEYISSITGPSSFRPGYTIWSFEKEPKDLLEYYRKMMLRAYRDKINSLSEKITEYQDKIEDAKEQLQALMSQMSELEVTGKIM